MLDIYYFRFLRGFAGSDYLSWPDFYTWKTWYPSGEIRIGGKKNPKPTTLASLVRLNQTSNMYIKVGTR